MSRKSKIDPVEKVKIVERYLDGEIGICQVEKESGIKHYTIRNWISIYQHDGPTGLLNQTKNKAYSKALKMSAVNDYLNGKGSFQDIRTKYGIRSHKQLSDWIKVYNCFYHRHSLANAIVNYIDYYNKQRIQRKLHIMTPME